MRVRFVVMVCVLALVALTATAQTSLNVRYGHHGAVRDLRVESENGLLFSAGEDGKVLVWRMEDEALIQSIQTDRLPARRLVLYPGGDRFAVINSDGDTHNLSVWNWRTGERQFIRTLEDQAFYLGISPQGTYLVYTVPSLQSVRILDADSGRELPFMRESTGIVTWAVVSNSEDRILTYVPTTGALTYRRIVTGSVLTEFSGPSNLDQIVLDGSRRYIAARTPQNRIVVVDLLSGNEVARSSVGAIRDIVRDPVSNEFIVLYENIDGRLDWRRYQFDPEAERLRLRYDTPRIIPNDVEPFVPADREFFAGTTDGRILRWMPFSRVSDRVAQPLIEPILDITATSSRLHVMTEDSVLTISTDFLRRPYDEYQETTYVRDRTTPVDAGPGTRFLSGDGSDLYLWSPESEEPVKEYQLYGSAAPLPFDLPSPLRNAQIRDGQILVSTRAQGVQILDRETGERTFQYRAIGVQDTLLTDVGLFLGKADQGVLDSPLLRVQPDTGETVPMDSDADLIFRLEYDSRRGRLFTIGVRTDGQRTRTVLEVHQGFALQQRQTILEVPGEHLSAALALDPTTGNIYTTLDDRGGIIRWDGNRVSEIRRNTAHMPTRLAVLGQYLVAINQDGTASLFDRESTEPVLDLYLLRRFSRIIRWVAVNGEGYFFTPYDDIANSEFLSVADPDTTLESRRLTIR